MRLLWVENHGRFVEVAGREFLSAHELTVVPSLAGAKACVAAEVYDAVLVDYDLDDGNGTELVEYICQLPARPAIIGTSSHERGNAALLLAGADAACPKRKFADIEVVISAAVGHRRI